MAAAEGCGWFLCVKNWQGGRSRSQKSSSCPTKKPSRAAILSLVSLASRSIFWRHNCANRNGCISGIERRVQFRPKSLPSAATNCAFSASPVTNWVTKHVRVPKSSFRRAENDYRRGHCARNLAAVGPDTGSSFPPNCIHAGRVEIGMQTVLSGGPDYQAASAQHPDGTAGGRTR